MAKDLYNILGVARDADEATIKKAYRKLARRYHPDVNQHDPEAEAKFKEVSQAYEILSYSSKRRQYDQFGHVGRGMGGEGFGGFGGADVGFENIFDMFFGDFTGQRNRQRQGEDGSDFLIETEVSFNEAAFGTEKVVDITRPAICDKCQGQGAAPGTEPITCSTCGGSGVVRTSQRTILGNISQTRTCPQCQGRGKIVTEPCKKCRGEGRVSKKEKIKVKIPAGIDTGVRIRVPGKGEAGKHGGATGDLYVQIKVKAHPVFERHNHDIFLQLPISFTQAALGCEIELPTLDGKDKVKIAPGTQNNSTITLKGKGIPYMRGRGRGNQIINVIVDTPTYLTEKQRELLREFAKLRGENGNHKAESLFDKIKSAFH